MSKTLTLKEPIQFGSETISMLTFRNAMAAGDMRGLNFDDRVGVMLDLAGKLCNQPPSVMDKLCMEDFAAVQEIVEGFLPDSLRTGAKQ